MSTYRVTIEGPSFLARYGQDEHARTTHVTLAKALSEALRMADPPRAGLLLGDILRALFDAECLPAIDDDIAAAEEAFLRAADKVSRAWDNFDRREQ